MNTATDFYDFLALLRNSIAELLQPWRLYQLGIIVAIFLVAHLASRLLRGRVEARAAELADRWPRAAEILRVVAGHLRALAFVLLAAAAVVVMRSLTWPSRSYLIGIAATLAAAWTFVSIASLVIRQRLLRTVVSWAAWILVTLHLLGLLPATMQLLDAAAVEFGDVRLSLLLVLKGAVTLSLLFALARWASEALDRWLSRTEELSVSMKVLTEKIFRLVVYGTAFVLGLQSVGFDLTSLTIFAGAIGVGIGFGLQKVVSNLISGLIIVLDKSIKPGDVISLGETFGWVNELGARYASVVTRDGREFLIPNEDLITGQVINWTRSSDFVRLDAPFGVSYDADPHEVRKIAVEAVRKVRRVVDSPAPVCHVTGFGESSVDFVLRFWIRDPVGGITNVRGEVYLALWDALKAADIEIPYPHREVIIRRRPARQ